jgi:hypothetical protein
MDSNVKARPNHYEILGLTPAASAAEIAQAFARKMSAFAARPLAAAAQLSIAFETLRDPERRRTYDESLRPPSAKMPSATVPPYTLRWNRMPFAGSTLAAPSARPQPRQEAAAEPKPFIAAPEPVSPKAIEPSPEPAPRSEGQRQELEPPRNAEPFVEQQRAIQRAIERGPAAQAEESLIGWNRTAMLVGGVVLGVGMLGAVAGWSAGLVEQPHQAEAAMTVALPRAKPPTASTTTTAAAAPEPAWSVVPTRPGRRSRAIVEPARSERFSPAASSLPLEELQTEPTQFAQSQDEAAVAEARPAAVVPASLSLPNPVIARTLGRIGYACGEVASTSPVEGAEPGVYKVTCTSGHSYQATPVRGRYHFRRLANR